MSDAEQQFIDAIHEQLNHAISYNLYTGIAYGTPHPTRHLITFWRTRLTTPSSAFRDVPRCVLHLNQDTSVRARAFHFRLNPPLACENTETPFFFSRSKGSLFHSPGHIFLFGITTFIFILATTVLAVGTGLTSQGIPIIIKMIDPSFVIGWSPHKVDVIVGVVAVITRLNARFASFLHFVPLS
jgi:hypothetical protein